MIEPEPKALKRRQSQPADLLGQVRPGCSSRRRRIHPRPASADPARIHHHDYGPPGHGQTTSPATRTSAIDSSRASVNTAPS